MALRSESYLSLAHSKQQTDSVEDKKKKKNMTRKVGIRRKSQAHQTISDLRDRTATCNVLE